MKSDLLDKTKKRHNSLKDTNKVHNSKISSMDKLALFITNKVGTMGFFFIIFGWTVLWLGWNFLAPTKLRFDPAPAFVLWLFISNLIQIHLMPVIMIGQNIQSKHSDLRAEHDLVTDKKAEKEIETILIHLENQNKLILDILKKIEKLEKRK